MRELQTTEVERTMRATINVRQALTDDDLRRISGDNPGWQVERAADGALILSPTSMESSVRNAELVRQLMAFARCAAGKVTGPDGGFTMPDGAVLSPDASWIRQEVWSQLSSDERDSFTHIVPAICIELRSRTDGVATLRTKLEGYRAAGAEYVLLVDPYERAVWSAGVAPDGFHLDLDAIFNA